MARARISYNQMNDDSDSESPQLNSDSNSQSSALINLAPNPRPPSPRPRPSQMLMPSPHVPRPLGSLAVSNTKPRLIIDKIVLENFKSYAGRQVIGPFHQNFTSVVGPNGSGKSNLIESMLFIFGYKANWMRLNRLNQLIHNSSTMTEIERASVEVQFKKVVNDERDQIQEVAGEGFSLRRVVKMTGASKYYINDRESTQGEVKDRLKDEGIDLNNNRFLILQGEVQQISQMKQKSGDREKPGLLEYLEDIIGSSVYIDQIEAGVQEYNAIEETKHEKGELMKLAQVELRNMNKGKDEAIRYVKKERQIYQIHNILQQVIISNNRHAAKEHQERLLKAEAERQRIISEEKEKLKKQADRIREIKRNKAEIDNIQKQLEKENEIMNKLNFSDKNINQEISFRSEDHVKYSRKLKQLDTELARIINESDEVKNELPEGKAKLEKLEKHISEMEEQLAKYDKPELKKKLKGLENDLKKCNHEIGSFEEKRRTNQRNLENKFKSSENIEIRKLDAEKRLQDEGEALTKIVQADTAATKIKDTLSRELDDLGAKRKELVLEVEKVQGNLKESMSQNQEMGMFNNMFEKIMQQRFPGVVGRLGDLGSVPRQYDEIITSSCSRLDNIVVQTLEAANLVLNFLKVTKLGRVTCIILDKIGEFKKYMQRPWTPLPNTVRLFDVIKPANPQVLVAFYFALSDTIYCEDSQQGMEYSMKDDHNRRRVVSKKTNGYIIYELNGLMNGCPARKGGFDVKAKSKIKNTQAGETKQLQQEKEKLSAQIAKIEERFKAIKNDYDAVLKDLEQIRRQRKVTESRLAEARQQLAQIAGIQLKNSKGLQEEKSKREKQIEAIKEKLQELAKQRERIQAQIKQIEDQQRSSETDKIGELRDDYKISKQEHTLLEKQVQKKVAILETTVKRVTENKKAKDELTKKLNMLETEIEKLRKQMQDIEVRATETIGRIKAGEDKILACRKIESDLKALFEDEEKEVRESKLKIDKARQQVELCTNKIRVYEIEIEKATQELSKEREMYKQLSATYDFLEELESIEGLNIDNVKKNVDLNKSLDSSVLLNQSLDSSNISNGSRMFPIDRLLETPPFMDLDDDTLDPFLLFAEKMRTMLVTEEQNLKKMSGNNLQVISEFRAKFADFKKKHEEFESVKKQQGELKRKIEELKEKRLLAFREGFGVINSKLKEVYQLLTKGGDAELELIDSLDPFSDGINFSVRPPKKAWKEINKLSGGEKTLSSLSLIFALHYYKPTPLYFMDEIDAALDFKNVSIVAEYIKKRTKDAQFIIISLRNNMFEQADKLVGVYKTYDKTKIIHFVPSRMRKNQRGPREKENLDSNENLSDPNINNI